ncbi:MAG TPA: MFS transporter [Actinomycetota bacterium]
MSRPKPERPNRVPIWQLVLLGVVRAFQGLVTHPLKRMWVSSDPIDAYALNHMTSVAGDALLAVALADSVFFSLPVGESRDRVALFLLLTMVPLSLAGPVLVPILDRAGPRRWVTIAAALGRAGLVFLLAPRVAEPVGFLLVLFILVLSKIHGVSKNALTMAYANREEGLLRANARLGRIAVVGALVAAPLGYLILAWLGVSSPLYIAAIVYATSGLLALRLPQPRVPRTQPSGAPPAGGPAAARADGPRGSLPHLAAPAIGAIGLRAAGGFLIFLLAFALRSAEVPAYWFAVLGAAGVFGGFIVDMVAPSLPRNLREEVIVLTCVSAAGIGALLASQLFGLPLLAAYAFIAGAATELARLAMQSLVQRDAPADALGRVFVRYEVLYQLAWVGAAFIPTVLPISFRLGIVLLAVFYGALAAAFWWRWRRALEP